MSTSRPAYHHGDLRRALVDAALATLAERGAAALGLRELARAVGVSPAAPYRHFADRKALLEAVAADGFARFGAAMEAAREASFVEDQLAAMAYAYVRFAIDNPPLFRLMFSPEISPYRDPALKIAAAAAYAPLATAAAREDAGAPAEVAVTAWSFVHGLSLLLLDEQILGVSAANADPLIHSLAARFVRGLRSS